MKVVIDWLNGRMPGYAPVTGTDNTIIAPAGTAARRR